MNRCRPPVGHSRTCTEHHLKLRIDGRSNAVPTALGTMMNLGMALLVGGTKLAPSHPAGWPRFDLDVAGQERFGLHHAGASSNKDYTSRAADQLDLPGPSRCRNCRWRSRPLRVSRRGRDPHRLRGNPADLHADRDARGPSRPARPAARGNTLASLPLSLVQDKDDSRSGAGRCRCWADRRSGARYWGAEKRNYHGEAVTPDNLQRAGHYTQMVWRATTLVGCRLARGHGSEVLVCRYDPAGSSSGRRPY